MGNTPLLFCLDMQWVQLHWLLLLPWKVCIHSSTSKGKQQKKPQTSRAYNHDRVIFASATIIESLRLERLLRSSIPTINPSHHTTNHILHCDIHPFLEQGLWLHHLPWQPVPMPDQSDHWPVNYLYCQKYNVVTERLRKAGFPLHNSWWRGNLLQRVI